MKLLFWNVRGCKKPFKQKEIKALLLKHKIDVCGLLETRVKNSNFLRISQKIFRNWHVINNYQFAGNGRIWLDYNSNKVSITVLEACNQGICVKMGIVGTDHELLFSAIYGCNSEEERRGLWSFITMINTKYPTAMFFCGDYNSLLSVNDRLNEAPVSEAEIREFADSIKDNNLYHMKSIGAHFTWCNNQEGDSRIHTKIDWCLANQSWMTKFPSVFAEILEKNVSDHAPILIHIEDILQHKAKLFKFLNVLADHPEFI